MYEKLLQFIVENKGILGIKVIPTSSENKIIFDEVTKNTKIKIREVPEDGKANSAVISVLSKELKISKSNIKIISGFTNSHKKVAFNI